MDLFKTAKKYIVESKSNKGDYFFNLKDILFLVGDGMINDPNIRQVKGPIHWWEENPNLKEKLLTKNDLYDLEYLKE